MLSSSIPTVVELLTPLKCTYECGGCRKGNDDAKEKWMKVREGTGAERGKLRRDKDKPPGNQEHKGRALHTVAHDASLRIIA